LSKQCGNDNKCTCISADDCPNNGACINNKCQTKLIGFVQCNNADDCVSNICQPRLGEPENSFCGCTAQSHCDEDQLCVTSQFFDQKICQDKTQVDTTKETIDTTKGLIDTTKEVGEKVTEKLPNFLGTDDPNVIFGRIVKTIIGIAGSFALLMFIYGGLMWLISRGQAEYIEKGKKAMKYAMIGLIIIFTSYIIVKLVITALGAIG